MWIRTLSSSQPLQEFHLSIFIIAKWPFLKEILWNTNTEIIIVICIELVYFAQNKHLWSLKENVPIYL